MSLAELRETIENLNDRLSQCQLELYEVKDLKEKQVGQLMIKLEKFKSESDSDWNNRMEIMKAEYEEKCVDLSDQLDLLRNAFSGDPGAWVEIINEKTGKVIYENKETEEIQENEPEVIYIAKAMKRIDEADTILKEHTELKQKFKELEMKKKELELTVTKLKTEANNFKSMEKNWKDGAKSMCSNLLNVKTLFDSQADQIETGLSGLSNAAERMQAKTKIFGSISQIVVSMRMKIKEQQEKIVSLSGKVAVLNSELQEKNKKIQILSNGFEDEVERICKPLRNKVSEMVTLLMKEKAGRATDRRELAVLWPEGAFMPTILQQYRPLTDQERLTRLKVAEMNSANLALSLEIRANITESRLWEINYDDYGRKYYQHKKTGQTSWEMPEICNYKPPPGRDENGNLLAPPETSIDNWKLLTDSKGQIFYRHKSTGEVSLTSPDIYCKIPKGKSRKTQVYEAARLVLDYLKYKLTQKKFQSSLQELQANIEFTDHVDDPTEDLSPYLYDIETIEMLSEMGEKKTKPVTSEEERANRRKLLYLPAGQSSGQSKELNKKSTLNDFLNDSTPLLPYRQKVADYLQHRNIDYSIATMDQLRDNLQEFSLEEESLENQLTFIREIIRDFSYVLIEKSNEKFKKPKSDDDDEDEPEDVGENESQSLQTTGSLDQKKSVIQSNSSSSTIDDSLDVASIDLERAVYMLPSTDMDEGRILQTANTNHKVNFLQKLKIDIRSNLTQFEINYGNLLLSDPSTDSNPSLFEYPQPFLDICSNLANFAIFCGYTHSNPHSTPTLTDKKFVEIDLKESTQDDQWLTSSFFLTISKEQIDAINSLLWEKYSPENGFEGRSGVHSLEIATQAFHSTRPNNQLSFIEQLSKLNQNSNSDTTTSQPNLGNSIENIGFKAGDRFCVGDQLHFQEMLRKTIPWSPFVRGAQDQIKLNHSLWISRQFLADILRYQIQDEIVKSSHFSLNESKFGYSPQNSTSIPFSPSFRLKIFNATLTYECSKIIENNSPKFIRFTYGSWSTRTASAHGRLEINPLAETNCYLTEWNSLEDSISLYFPISALQLQPLIIELFDESSFSRDSLLSSGKINLSQLIGTQYDIKLPAHVLLLDRFGEQNSLVTMTLSVDSVENRNEIIPEIDSNLHFEKIDTSMKTPFIDIKTNSLNSSVNSYSQDQYNFISLVNDLRGDGVASSQESRMMSLLTGDVKIEEILHRGIRIGPNTVQKLPNFQSIHEFMKMKESVHLSGLQLTLHQIFETYPSLQENLDRLASSTEKLFETVKSRHTNLSKSVEIAKNNTIKIQKQIDILKKPLPQPEEPVFEDLEDIPYVLKLPSNGALDARGKRKPMINKKVLEDMIKNIEKGGMDDTPWNFGESWPNNSQTQKLQEAILLRNQELDRHRTHELTVRQKASDEYKLELTKWVLEEKRRIKDLARYKKESRKAYLKYDCVKERLDRVASDLTTIQSEIEVAKSLLELHSKSKEHFFEFRTKQILESARQNSTITSLKLRLVQALDVRQRLLQLPGSAINSFQFEELKMKAEDALQRLKFEILFCKQALLEEGARLRLFHQEVTSTSRNELNRIRVLQDVIQQRESIEKILERNRFEVSHLLESLEKFKLLEADQDDKGFETIDNMEERYLTTKKWFSEEVLNCQKQINIILAKIQVTEGASRSASQSQVSLLESMTVKWGQESNLTKPSWIENSDFDRSSSLLNEIRQWIIAQRNRLQQQEQISMNELIEIQSRVHATKKEFETNLRSFESETKAIAESASSVVHVLQSSLLALRNESSSNKLQLEKNIYDLSKECQRIREENYSQALGFDEKLKILWSIIRTLQNTAQGLSVQMDIERERSSKLVIKAKLETERTRRHLIEERKHNANLLFVIHSQRGAIEVYKRAVIKMQEKVNLNLQIHKTEKIELRKQLWEHIFTFSRLSLDVDALFEFFTARLANLSGAKKYFNDSLAENNAAKVLAVLCSNPKPIVRKYAARALGGLGWDGYIEHRVLVWDHVLHWKLYKSKVLSQVDEMGFFDVGFKYFVDSGKDDSLLKINFIPEETESFVPSANMRLSGLIKQRRQWALRVVKRNEGPNLANQLRLNIEDGVIPALLTLCVQDGQFDWEIIRNAILAISIASYEPRNHRSMLSDRNFVQMLYQLCNHHDFEIQTHAALTVANLSYRDEEGQLVLGQAGIIPALIRMANSTIIDVLEASTSALANITCSSDQNCVQVFQSNGVQVTIDIISQRNIENLLDLDQCDEIQANAAEMLSNVSRYLNEETLVYFDTPAIDSLVYMCASKNKQVRRHAPLVLGNISQNENLREKISQRGGIEALFLALEDPDITVQANCLWALTNLMWHPPNQERGGRFILEVVKLMNSSELPVRLNACSLMANLLYYNFANRIRFIEVEGSMELILQFIRKSEDLNVIEESLRALLSLSYMDHISIWLGNENGGNCISFLLALITPPFLSRDTLRFSLEILCNLSIHHENRIMIVRQDGIQILVGLMGDSDKHIQDTAGKILEGLEELTPHDVVLRFKKNSTLEQLVSLTTNSDPLVRAVAAESIGEEIWKDKSNQERVNKIGGVDSLLAILSNKDEPLESVLPSLWTLRNLAQDNLNVKHQIGFRDGIPVLVTLLKRSLTGVYQNQTERVLEGVLLALIAASENEPRNARRLLQEGLKTILDLAEGRLRNDIQELSKISGSLSHPGDVLSALSSEGPLSLCRALLMILGPFNYAICKNCGKKQNQHGESCLNCGNFLRVDSTEISEENKHRRLKPIEKKNELLTKGKEKIDQKPRSRNLPKINSNPKVNNQII